MFMIGNFIYWSYHVIDVSYLRGGFNAYSTKFLVGDATNHHIVGQAVSVSSLFLAINYFFKYGRLSVPGYLILIWTLFILLLSETRSNFLITLLGSAIIVFRESKNFGRLIFLVIPLFFTVLYVFSLFVFENDNIKQRFDVNDSEYIEHTTDIRIVMLQEGLATFLSNPQGIGMLNMTVKINNKDLMLHNQYLSFLISGGLLALMGVLIWIGSFGNNLIRVLRESTRRGVGYSTAVIAIMMVCMIFYFTLFTVESTGILFYVILSLTTHGELINKRKIIEMLGNR